MSNASPIVSLLSRFTDSICSKQDIQSRINILSQIKAFILQNPNNYHHDLYGNVTFFNVYEFVIECLSNQHHPSVLNFMLHVLALMTKFWVTSVANLRELYDGILEMFQQRMYCGENCFRFLCVLVETMQENEDSIEKTEDGEMNGNKNVKLSENSSITVIRKSIENYFVYHLLNELLAFANVFLERAVVRNKELITNKTNKEENSRSCMSQSFNHSRTSQEISDSELSQEEECELYLIQQPEPILLAILSLIRACLSYDFSHTSRNHQESDYEQQKSPIILPTKYSKYCKFSEYDILLKNENTTEMFNYLFLVCKSGELKIEILKILKIMTRIHFRYFKNKSIHKTHLENIGYVIANLLTGLDLSESSISRSISNSTSKNQPKTNEKYKIKMVLELSEIVCLLLFHQPTFYMVDISLITMLVEHVEAFILNELLDKDNFSSEVEETDQDDDCFQHTKICSEDVVLLIEGFMANLYQLKDYCKIYLNDDQALSEKVNEMYIKIGKQYFEVLNIDTKECEITNPTNLSKQIQTFQVENNSILYADKIDGNANNNTTDNMDINKREVDKNEAEEENEETQANIRNHSIPCLIENNAQKENQSNFESEEFRLCENGQNSASIRKNFKSFSKFHPRKHESIGLIKSLILEGVKANRISNILSIFKTYCPKHDNIILQKEERFGIKGETRENEIISNRQNIINAKNSNQMTNITKWTVSWLCNFEHYFFVTSGYCRHSEEWEKEVKLELLKELIEDLNLLLSISIKEILNLSYSEVKQLNFVIIFLFDKIGNESRIPPQEYLEAIGFDFCVAYEWIIESTTTLRKWEKDSEGEFGDLIEMIGGWNFAKTSADPSDPKTIYTYHQILKLIHRLSTLFPIQTPLPHISSSFPRKLFQIMNSNIKTTFKEPASIMNEKEVSQITWVVLKMYVQYRPQSETKNEEINKQLNIIFSSGHHNILVKVLTYLWHELKCVSHIKSVQLLLIYDLLQPFTSIESIQQNNLLYFQNNLNENQSSFNLKIAEILFANSIRCFIIDLEIRRKYTPTESKLEPYLHFMQEAIEFAYLLPIDHAPLSILLHSYPMLLEAQLHPHCEETLVSLATKLINYTKAHKEIILSLPIDTCSVLIQDYLSTLQMITCSNSLNQIIMNQSKGQELEILIVDDCIFIFEILVQLGSTFGCRHSQIISIEENFLEFLVPYQNTKFSTSNNRTNLLTILESSLHNTAISSCEKANQIILFNTNLIIKSTLSYLSAQTIETTFLQNQYDEEPIHMIKPVPISINHEEASQCDNQTSGNKTGGNPNRLIRKEVLKIDNLINIFELYYKIIEFIIEGFPSVLNDETEMHPIMKEGIKMLSIKGVGWVVRKLEEWDNLGVTLGNEEIEKEEQKYQFENRNETICEEPTQPIDSEHNTKSIENDFYEHSKEIVSTKETGTEIWEHEETKER